MYGLSYFRMNRDGAGFAMSLAMLRVRHWILALWSFALVGLSLVLPPIAQPAAYHGFVDQRVLWGIPNFGDVVSNLAFVFVGGYGLAVIFFGRTRGVFRELADRIPYAVFFLALILVGAGSAYYHWAPTNGTLFWDRAMMSLAFMALFASVLADRVNPRLGRWALPICLLIGVSVVVAWRFTGDVRFYVIFAQVWPLSCIVLIVFLLYRKGHYVSTPHVAFVALLYGCAVAFENQDANLWMLTGQRISGHTLKHLAAASAVAVVIPMLARLRFQSSNETKRPREGSQRSSSTHAIPEMPS